jgi:hypothetical protein
MEKKTKPARTTIKLANKSLATSDTIAYKDDSSSTFSEFLMVMTCVVIFIVFGWMLHSTFAPEGADDHARSVWVTDEYKNDIHYILYRVGNTVQIINYSLDSAKMERLKPAEGGIILWDDSTSRWIPPTIGIPHP